MPVQSIGTPALWAGFVIFVILMLALDLGVFNRKAHVISVREALAWTGVWVALAGVFAIGVYVWFGTERALEFVTGYVIEKALAVDNIFVFAVVFGYFAVPAAFQHRVLFWGIFGALGLRALFIGLGAALLARFHWVLYVFGVILIYTGAKLFLQKETHEDPGERAIVRLFRRWVPSTPAFHGQAFVVKQNGKWLATPLLLVLLVLEASDVMFAIDSIPAIFAVTLDPFIVFTSNIFAILGLRSMYFLLSGIIEKFRYLKYGLAAVLCFVGIKMLLADVYPIPILVSLSVIAFVLIASVVASMVSARRHPHSLPAPEVPREPTPHGGK